jgi:Domain of unknown function (DUF4253)
LRPRYKASIEPLACEDRPWKVALGCLRVCTVGPFGTIGGTRWDQDPVQDHVAFERSNTLSNRPVEDVQTAAHAALEHVLTGADNVNEDWPPFADYAASLIGARLWSFWWD